MKKEEKTPLLKDLPVENRGKEKEFWYGSSGRTKVSKPSILLHSCCGPCSTAVIEQLAEEHRIIVFFYNPNITEQEEYIRRRASQKKFIREYNEDPDIPYTVEYQEGPYDTGNFFQVVKGQEADPEGGPRCDGCFRLRLEKTAEMARLLGCDYFTSTLTVSPHKDYQRISRIGNDLALSYGVSFLDRNFKKKAGFQRSIFLAKAYDLYRQNYCGCIFSKKQAEKHKEEQNV